MAFQIPSVLIMLVVIISQLFLAICHVSTASKKTYIVHMSKSDMPMEFQDHELWYTSSLKSVSGSAEMLYSYDHAIHGFSATLTEDEAREMEDQAGVLSVMPDTRLELHTTRTPILLGLAGQSDRDDKYPHFLPDKSQQQNVVIGLIDCGIWPESPSLDDTGYGPIPSSWQGECENGINFNVAMCNKKLIGARSFYKGYEQAAKPVNWTLESKSPRDDEGHGTHTTTTAAGSAVSNASLLGYANGTARGMVPWARVAAYKACWKGGCYNTDILKAIDTAISDGVHVLSISIGGRETRYYGDNTAIGAFAAAAKGIFVSCSAGNDGPFPFGVTNVAPWIATVGAGTIDRDFPAYVKLDNGKTYAGMSLYSGPLFSGSLFIVYAGNVSIDHIAGAYCQIGYLIPELVKGKIVVCDRGINDRVEKGLAVKYAGGAGMILANTKDNREEILADAHILPAIAVGQIAGDEIKKYIYSSQNNNLKATFQFGGTRLGVKPSPVLAAFSSRGPSTFVPEVLKPDLIAPGVNILAAWPRGISPVGLRYDNRKVDFNIMSGTSMSCPHVSGLAALLKAAHPDWSPAAIRSALMTTANQTDTSGNPMIDEFTGNASTPLDYGAGYVNPVRALDPGLVYDLTTEDYLNFLCALNYTPHYIQLVARQISFACDPNKTYSTTELNYPSFVVLVPANINGTTVITHKRTVTNVGSSGSTYKVSVSSPSSSVKVSAFPTELSFRKPSETLSYTLTFEVTGSMPPDTYQFGQIKWLDEKHVVASPIAIGWT
ncbi:Subtilisin-like protease SBT1.7 [Striga hermonthica]|uniref:Subtilisin-like protease SBT1.7 n=1 Tax=Striga hermonthica TaxID=68872 RepID=A0A9N7RMY4_STRHE|nr:Subtilisin-like protease SBT1.7 [Striga hermonthica]